MSDRKRGRRFIPVLACAAMLLPALLPAQPSLRLWNFEVNWPAVRMRVQVKCGSVDRKDLSEANFIVTENGNAVESFTVTCPDPATRCCVSVALVGDRSGSMGWGSPSGLEGEKAGFKALIDSLDQSGAGCDEATLISFNQYVTVDVPMTRDKVLLKQGVDALVANGNTALWDAGVTAVQQIVDHGTQPCRAVILLTDGEDNSSSLGPDTLIARAVAAHVQVFTVGLGTGINEGDLKLVAAQTGGQYYKAAAPDQIGTQMSEINAIIHQSFCALEYLASCPDGTIRNGGVVLRNLAGCAGTDAKSFQYTAPNDPGAFQAARITAAGLDARGDEIVLVPVTLDDPVNFSFHASTLRILIDTQYCTFLGLSTAGCLLDGIPVSVTQLTGNTLQIRITAGRTLPGAGVLFFLRMLAANPPRSASTPLRFESWTFDSGCLIPDLTDGLLRINIDQPRIATDPDSVTACRGEQITLSASVSGDPPLTMQWRKSADGGAHWTDEPGANQPTYVISAVNAPLYDNTLWRLFVRRPGGDSAISRIAKLALLPSVTVAAQPSDTAACLGGTARFFARPGFTSGVGREWQTSADSGKSWAAIPGAATDTLILSPVTANLDGVLYRIAYADSCGARAVSAGARLSVDFPPVVLRQPADDSVCENASARFIARTGSAADRRVWQRSTDGGSAFSDLPGESRDTLDLPAVRLWQDGEYYRLKVMNGCDTVETARAALHVDPAAPLITAQPRSASICDGDSVRFTVAAAYAAGYQWSRNGVDIPGATGPSYRIPRASPSDSGSYRVLATSRCGQTLSSAAILTIGAPVAILSQPQSQNVREGDSVRFIATAAGSGLSYQWMKDGIPIPGATGPDYIIFPVKKSDEGRYTVLVSGSCGPPLLSAAAQLAVTIVMAERDLPLPGRPELYPNYPNPFAAATTIQFALPARQNIEISILDMYGRKIETLAAGEYEAGRHALSFIANSHPAGMYVLTLATERGVLAGKLTIVR